MKIFESISVTLLLAVNVVFYAVFIVTFLNDGLVTIDINSIGEAPYELVILAVILIIGTITLIRVTKRIGE